MEAHCGDGDGDGSPDPFSVRLDQVLRMAFHVLDVSKAIKRREALQSA